MSTRATVHFQKDGVTRAIVYRHSDGYPEGLGEDLKIFFAGAEKLADRRFNDPTYLAAKFVVWQAGQYARSDSPLDFLSIGVMMEDPDDIEYRYLLGCDNSNAPKITIEKV